MSYKCKYCIKGSINIKRINLGTKVAVSDSNGAIMKSKIDLCTTCGKMVKSMLCTCKNEESPAIFFVCKRSHALMKGTVEPNEDYHFVTKWN